MSQPLLHDIDVPAFTCLEQRDFWWLDFPERVEEPPLAAQGPREVIDPVRRALHLEEPRERQLELAHKARNLHVHHHVAVPGVLNRLVDAILDAVDPKDVAPPLICEVEDLGERVSEALEVLELARGAFDVNHAPNFSIVIVARLVFDAVRQFAGSLEILSAGIFNDGFQFRVEGVARFAGPRDQLFCRFEGRGLLHDPVARLDLVTDPRRRFWTRWEPFFSAFSLSA